MNENKTTEFLGYGYKHILSIETREALSNAYIILVDNLLDWRLSDSQDKIIHLDLSEDLIEEPQLLKRFILCLINVGHKLGSKDYELDLASCYGEEAMLETLINRARLYVEDNLDRHDLHKFNKEMSEFRNIVFEENGNQGVNFYDEKESLWFKQYKDVNTHINPFLNADDYYDSSKGLEGLE